MVVIMELEIKKQTQFSVKRKRNHLLTREAHSAPIDKEHSLKFSAKISFLLFNIKFILQWFARWSRPGTNCSVEPGGTNRAGDHSGTTAALKGNLNPSRHIWKTLNRMAEESRAGQSTLIIVPNQLWSSPTLDPPESVSANWQNQAINFQITTSCTWGGRAWKASAGLNMSEMHFMISPRCGERGGRHSINAGKTKKGRSQLSSDFYWNQCKEIFGWSGFALLTVVGFIFSCGLQMPN